MFSDCAFAPSPSEIRWNSSTFIPQPSVNSILMWQLWSVLCTGRGQWSTYPVSNQAEFSWHFFNLPFIISNEKYLQYINTCYITLSSVWRWKEYTKVEGGCWVFFRTAFNKSPRLPMQISQELFVNIIFCCMYLFNHYGTKSDKQWKTS